MKITFVMDGGLRLSGGARVIATYAHHLQKRGHDVFVVSRPLKPVTLRQQLRSLKQGKGLISTANSLVSPFDRLNIPHKLLDRWRPIVDADVPDSDVVIATWWETAEWVAKLSEAKGAKAYLMQDYGAPGQELEKIIPTWRFPLHIITIAPWLVNLIHSHCGEIPISLIPNSVDFETFYALPRTKQPRPTIGVSYRSMTSKGTDVALDAVRLARKVLPDLKFIAYGLEKPDKLLPLPPDTFYKYQPSDEEIRQIYERCDAWLFPSRLEGFGLPILEAMACRTPVIGTTAGAAPELLGGGSGLLVRPDDPEDMARAIVQICQLSPEQWRQMSDAAYVRATGYTWDDATTLFEAALQTAIDRQRRGDFICLAH